MSARPQDWCILRCKGANTLRLAASLHAEGFEVWTPAEEIGKRERQRRGKRRDTVPVMPTYVFARARHLPELIAESAAFASPHPDFGVFHYYGQIPLIADETLDPLRVAERRGTPLEKVARFTQGERVRCAEAGFQGLSGVVETTKGQFTLVCFPGFSLPIKVRSLLLLPESGNGGEQVAARQAA